MSGQKERKRVRTQAEACDFLGVGRSRLQEMEKDAKWWENRFRTDDGYDVVGIAKAQSVAEYKRNLGTGTTTTPTTENEKKIALWDMSVAEANAQTAIETSKIKKLDRQARERVKLREEDATVGSDVAVEALVASYQGLRRQLDDLAYNFHLECPPDFVPLVYVAGSKIEVPGSEVEPAKLHQMTEDVSIGFAQLLDLYGTDMFVEEEQEG